MGRVIACFNEATTARSWNLPIANCSIGRPSCFNEATTARSWNFGSSNEDFPGTARNLQVLAFFCGRRRASMRPRPRGRGLIEAAPWTVDGDDPREFHD